MWQLALDAPSTIIALSAERQHDLLKVKKVSKKKDRGKSITLMHYLGYIAPRIRYCLTSSTSTTCAGESLARQKPLVFLSHEGGGPDKTTKRNEVSLLHSWLKSKGIPAFLDEYSLQLGDDNAQVMIAAVKEAPVCES